MTWTWTSSASLKKAMESQHCPDVDVDSASSFLINIAVPILHPNAKIVSVLPLRPEGQAALAAQYGQPPQTLSLDGARVRVQYVRDGQPVEEQLLSVVDCHL